MPAVPAEVGAEADAVNRIVVRSNWPAVLPCAPVPTPMTPAEMRENAVSAVLAAPVVDDQPSTPALP